MRLPYKVPAYALGVAGTAVIGLAACGSGGHTTGSGAPSTSGCTATSAHAHQVTVCETEYHISLSSTTLTAGAWTFVVDNNGRIEHSLEIKGPGVSVTSPLLSPGQPTSFQATLRDGTYELWCPVPGHKALGMDTHITVTG